MSVYPPFLQIVQVVCFPCVSKLFTLSFNSYLGHSFQFPLLLFPTFHSPSKSIFHTSLLFLEEKIIPPIDFADSALVFILLGVDLRHPWAHPIIFRRHRQSCAGGPAGPYKFVRSCHGSGRVHIGPESAGGEAGCPGAKYESDMQGFGGCEKCDKGGPSKD